MNAGDRYFMAVIDLLCARDRIQRIIDSVEFDKGVPSVELMAASIKDLTDAMIKTQRDRLSDPRFIITPECQAEGCWEAGDVRVCLNHSCDVVSK